MAAKSLWFALQATSFSRLSFRYDWWNQKGSGRQGHAVVSWTWLAVTGTVFVANAGAGVITRGGSTDGTKWVEGVLPVAGDIARTSSGVAYANADLGISSVTLNSGV